MIEGKIFVLEKKIKKGTTTGDDEGNKVTITKRIKRNENEIKM